MSDHGEPIKTLVAARDRLIEERRALSVAIALGYRRRRSDDPQTNEMRETFVALQTTIEAIGRAIEDEQQAASRPIEPIHTVAEAADLCAGSSSNCLTDALG